MTIAKHGKPIGHIVPLAQPTETQLEALKLAGLWMGQRCSISHTTRWYWKGVTRMEGRTGLRVYDRWAEWCDPRPSGVRKLVGHESLSRIRVGQYRVVYDIDDQGRSIRITRIRHRREVGLWGRK